MEEILGYCGLVCHNCAIYLATREKDQGKKRKMRAEIAQQIKKTYGTESKTEDIGDCDGCRTEGGKLFCTDCRIRICAKGKNIENCAHCSDYACEKLEEFFVTDPEAKTRLETIRNAI